MFKDLPSKEHLRELKRSGHFAWSDLAIRLVLVAAVTGVLLVCGNGLAEMLIAYGEQVGVGQEFSAGEVIKLGRGALAKVVVVTSVGVVVVGVLAALLQTRGAFGLSVFRRSHKTRRRGNLFSFLCAFILLATVSVVVFKGLVPQLLGAVKITDLAQYQLFYGSLLSRIGKQVVVVAVVLAILLVFVSRVRFLLAMRGTRRNRLSQNP
jgi:flagellar biosynthesis protein FlhB